MSTENLTLYSLEATLMRLMFEREDIATDQLLSDAERRSALNRKDLEIREHVAAEVKKVDEFWSSLMVLLKFLDFRISNLPKW